MNVILVSIITAYSVQSCNCHKDELGAGLKLEIFLKICDLGM